MVRLTVALSKIVGHEKKVLLYPEISGSFSSEIICLQLPWGILMLSLLVCHGELILNTTGKGIESLGAN